MARGRGRTAVASQQIVIEEDGIQRTGRYTEYSDKTLTVISDEGREWSGAVGNSDAASVARMHLYQLVADFGTGRIRPLHANSDD
jgi:hypothetical protein